MSKELIKALLSTEFYEKHKHRLGKDSFQDSNAKWLFETIEAHYAKHQVDISVSELKALHYAFNPAITSATKRNLDLLFDELEATDVSSAVGEELVLAQFKLNQFTELAQMAMDAADNKEVSFEKMQLLISSAISAALPPMTEEEYITDDLDALFSELAQEFKYKFPAPISSIVPGIGGGVFALIAARPNVGKTAFMVSLCAQPGGFLEQGAIVHYLGVEEKSARTKIRAINSYTGMTRDEIVANKEKAAAQWNKVKTNFFLKDVVGMDLTELEEYVKMHQMDILIIDQLDKIKVSGSFAGNHDKFGFLYIAIREMAKKYNIAIIGVCQASNDAEGKLYFGMDCLAESKTSKSAELDLCICIGKESFTGSTDTGYRMANVVKNKLNGVEESVGFMFDRHLSRIAA